MSERDHAAEYQQTLATNRALSGGSNQSEVSSGASVGNGGGGEGITPGMTTFGENSIEIFSPENLDSTLGEMKKGSMSGSAIENIAGTFEQSGPLQNLDKFAQDVVMQPHAGQAVAPPTAAQDFQLKKTGLVGRD